MTFTATAATQQIRQTFRLMNLDLPKRLAADLTEAEESTRITLAPGDAGEVARAALAAQAEGRDPAEDTDVRTAITRVHLTQLSVAIDHTLQTARDKAMRDALTKHAPAIIEAMRPLVEAADASLNKAREALGRDDLQLTRTTVASTLSAQQLTPWAMARDARADIERVEQAWTQLAAVMGVANVNDHTRVLIVADTLNPSAVATYDRHTFGVPAHISSATGAVDAGLPLSLATFEQFAERVAEAEENRQADAERAQGAFERARSHVFNVS
ncbi:hypothetical protein [Nocardioides jishulii]|uniref:Uncharacterized protein n=1 Tax=Nocardioides jishulii TaxID=2575440 RepID=A0A4U2YI63_9ACTN|nr:hypothetical protein [Nocardioides jishulii]QCX28084.1 hypothetical protein FCL41_11565 [Nocardioides jishulii]TKI60748.1 hypothetical protein FC770_14640 [Nocardioides jishulii]